MGKITTIENYINLLDRTGMGHKVQDSLLMEIISVYQNEIEGITYGLSMYSYDDGKGIDYSGDVQKIRAKLINYKDNIELEEQRRKDEIELARLRQGNINVSANANNSNAINLNITLEQAIERINQIPDGVMTEEEKDDLEDKLSGIDTAVKSGKKEKAKEKIVAVLKFLIDKGADALIAMLPYLAQMAGMI